jgi:hypothetical protein
MLLLIAASCAQKPTVATTLTLMPLPAAPPTSSPPAISPSNVGGLTQLARWGLGLANAVARAPDGEMLAIASRLCIHLHDAGTLEELYVSETLTGNIQGDITVLRPDGSVKKRIPVDGAFPTNVAFAGPGQRRVLVTEGSGNQLLMLETPLEGLELHAPNISA